MSNDPKKRPECYGNLDKVFPLREDGFRVSPIECMQCIHKTECLRSAIGASSGFSVREEMVDRAYRGGLIGFFNRWSQKKAIHRMKKSKSSDNT
ncbi:MAG: hypothetical protein PVH87_20680 [Desulfobacteraceae bacterium]|jgi:hypothetical protein